MEELDINTVLKELQKDLNKIYKPIANYINAKPNDPERLVLAEKALKLLPDGLEYIRDKYLPAIQTQLLTIQQEYKKLETVYLRSVKERGDLFREAGEGWRVGILMLETKPMQGVVRFCYNRESLTPWIDVTSVADIQDAEMKVLKMMKLCEVPEQKLTRMMWLAYKKAVVAHHNQLEGQKVYIKELQDEFNALLLRDHELSKTLKSFFKKGEVPQWVFLYNLDRYRMLNAAAIPAGERIGLQTGSQQEVSNNHGLTINGLLPEEDYKTMCHVITSQAISKD